jgi:hypothetical protein
MSKRTVVAQPKAVAPTHSATLQRKCACGQHTIAGDDCAECRQISEGPCSVPLVSPAPGSAVPSIIHDVLSSSGQPLDPATRALGMISAKYECIQMRRRLSRHER